MPRNSRQNMLFSSRFGGPIINMFTGQKTAQMAAYFTNQEGGQINILKLIKLLYLADRESMDRYGEPISYDHLVSMDHGPVLSRTLNLINGHGTSRDIDAWQSWISDRENYLVSISSGRTVNRDVLDHLSDADISVLQDTWDRFGHMNRWELRDYTHAHIAEWQDPHGSSLPISERHVFTALGKSEEEADQLAREIREQRDISRNISAL